MLDVQRDPLMARVARVSGIEQVADI